MEETRYLYEYEQQQKIEPEDAQNELFRQMGGVYGWCRHRFTVPDVRSIKDQSGLFTVWIQYLGKEEWEYRLLYWRPARRASPNYQAPRMRRHRVWSGYRSFDRGRHWDRKRR